MCDHSIPHFSLVVICFLQYLRTFAWIFILYQSGDGGDNIFFFFVIEAGGYNKGGSSDFAFYGTADGCGAWLRFLIQIIVPFRALPCKMHKDLSSFLGIGLCCGWRVLICVAGVKMLSRIFAQSVLEQRNSIRFDGFLRLSLDQCI